MSKELDLNLIPERTRKEQIESDKIEMALNMIDQAISIAKAFGGEETEETKAIDFEIRKVKQKLKIECEKKTSRIQINRITISGDI